MTGLQILYYVRHGESGSNVARVLSHRTLDPDLTERGYLQARQAAELLSTEPAGTGPIFTSPLKRAIQTAATIGERLGRTVQVIEELRELNVGDLEGRSDDAAFATWWGVLEAWASGDREARFASGESHVELTQRVQKALACMLGSQGSGPHVVVAHAGWLRAGFMALADPPPPTRLKIPNCSVSRLEIHTRTDTRRFAYLARAAFLSQETGISATTTATPAGA